MTTPYDDEQIKRRVERIDSHNKRTGDQQRWYSMAASKNKNLFQFTSFAIVIVAATITFAPIFSSGDVSLTIVEKITTIMGALIVVLKGIERIWLPEEKWQNYRKASESLKREKESYTENISPYSTHNDEDEKYQLYVKRCVLIKAEEQKNFWGLSGENGDE